MIALAGNGIQSSGLSEESPVQGLGETWEG